MPLEPDCIALSNHPRLSTGLERCIEKNVQEISLPGKKLISGYLGTNESMYMSVRYAGILDGDVLSKKPSVVGIT